MSKRLVAGRLNSSAVLTLLVGAWALMASTPSRADTPQATAAEAPAMSEVTVTARRRAERLLDVPVSATAIPTSALEHTGTVSLGQLNTLVPTLSFDKAASGSGASLSLRGVSSSSTDAGIEQSISIEIDGMQISRGRILNDGLFDIQSIDVFKGPQALYFGKNSPGGVVSIASRNPGHIFEGYAKVGYEFETHAASFEGAVGGPITDTLGARISVFASHSDGYIRNVAQPIPSPAINESAYAIPTIGSTLGGEEKLGGRITVVFTPTDTFEANFKLFGSNFSGSSMASLQEVMSCPNGATRPTELVLTQITPTTVSTRLADPYGDCRLNAQTSMGTIPQPVAANFPLYQKAGGKDGAHGVTALPTLTMTYRLPHVTLTSVTGFYHNEFWTAGNTESDLFASFEVVSEDVNNVVAQELRAATSFDSPVNFTGGVLYEHTNRKYYIACRCNAWGPDPHPGFADNGRTDTDSLVELNQTTTESVYGQVTWKIVPSLELAGGARYTHETEASDIFNDYVHQLQLLAYKAAGAHLIGNLAQNNVSPEATLTWHFSPRIMLYGAYKTGYLAGTISNPGNLIPARTIDQLLLKPVDAKGGEIGAKASLFGGALNADLTIYHYEYDNLQLTAYDVPSNSVITKNAGSAITEGFELQARYRVNEDLSLHGDLSVDHAYYGSFPDAQCYTGQTRAAGCVPTVLPGGGAGASVQDLTGRPLSRAPKWTFDTGFVFDHPVFNVLSLQITGDLHYKSTYNAEIALNPGAQQPAYTLLDASIALSPLNGPWEVRLIGRNLTNVYYAGAAGDKPGGIGEVNAVLGETRRVELQFSNKF